MIGYLGYKYDKTRYGWWLGWITDDNEFHPFSVFVTRDQDRENMNFIDRMLESIGKNFGYTSDQRLWIRERDQEKED